MKNLKKITSVLLMTVLGINIGASIITNANVQMSAQENANQTSEERAFPEGSELEAAILSVYGTEIDTDGDGVITIQEANAYGLDTEEDTELSVLGMGLSGTIDGIEYFANATFIYLAYNDFVGLIPENIGNLTNVTALDLSGNELSGAIPASIGNVGSGEAVSYSSDTWIDLSYNHLSGEIPASVGNLTKVSTLSLSDNQLSGPIPDAIANLTQAWNINLRNNQLDRNVSEAVDGLVNNGIIKL